MTRAPWRRSRRCAANSSTPPSTSTAAAAQLESLAAPGGINVSRAVRDQVRDRLPIAFEDLGEHEVKNIARPVRVFRIILGDEAAAPVGAVGSPRRKAAAAPGDKSAVAVLPFQNLG